MEYLPSYKDDLYLMHHGIKGQKWGVRRFQNPDGSLTNEGKKRIQKYSETGAEIGGTIGLIGGMFTPSPIGVPLGASVGSIAGQAAGQAIGKGVVSGKINKQLGIKVAKGAAITAGLLAGSYGVKLLSEQESARQDFETAKNVSKMVVSKHLSDLSSTQKNTAEKLITAKNARIFEDQRQRKNRARTAMRNDFYEAYINPKTVSKDKRIKFATNMRLGYYEVPTRDTNDTGFINENNFSKYEEGIRRSIGAIE